MQCLAKEIDSHAKLRGGWSIMKVIRVTFWLDAPGGMGLDKLDSLKYKKKYKLEGN